MPVKYISYIPNVVEGQAVLDNFVRTRRVLRYRDNDKVYDCIKRGLPLYEVEKIESITGTEPTEVSQNIIIRGECLSACAYLKDKGIKVDLVYIDPPFASGADYAKKVYIRRNPKITKKIALAEQEMDIEELRSFEEKMYGDIWNKEDYLNWMYENLSAIKSIMSDTGSIYVHLDWHIGHYVKILMDEVFGEDHFKNEIVWKTQTASGMKALANKFGSTHDTIFWYSKNDDFVYNPQFLEVSDQYIKRNYPYEDEKGFYKTAELQEPSESTIKKLDNDGLLYRTSNGKVRYKMYAENSKGILVDDLWNDFLALSATANERNDYATQKPESLLERIIEASSIKGMLVADFFGGSGVTAKAANDLKRNFIHVDVGVNSIQTTRDRLKATKATFDILDVKDGVSLFRNPVQTMDKLKSLITGLRNEDSLDNFWEGAINDSKLGLIPVYVPNLLDHSTKVLDIPMMNRIINEAVPDLPENTKQVIVYYIDIDNEKELLKFIDEYNNSEVKIILRDLKALLDEVVINDIIEFEVKENEGVYEIEFTKFISDRLMQKINEYNQKKSLNKNNQTLLDSDEESITDEDEIEDNEEMEADEKPKKTKFKSIEISDCGLELIEMISLDYTNKEGVIWNSDVEIKIDKNGYLVDNGKKTKLFWDGKITSEKKPLRMKVRNIAGDETIISL